MLMQEIWIAGTDWDGPLLDETNSKCRELRFPEVYKEETQ